eukprot:CAMPEP_0177195404 /NCGR_PEP_ID=MMETSP0367-20130122/23499_1 /TAXON_ID=447022 ORGANISM="Scrippsiella hangoei-like, Strain SHHI-4" /NCGR_SAMPLE_ID=MMETSP0367 /ASSEMBLY_ACC=CAM_ASM_000362 /LENGTH=277 /DNA_ID=CAMNT_0018643437 /DNA_START=50 /DNA_END=883 /DNA_ORIENTATION=-
MRGAGGAAFLLALLGSALLVVVTRGDEGDEDEIEQDALTREQMRGLHGVMDKSGDGKVSMSEIMSFSDHMRREIASKDIGTVLEEMDGDKDGKLSLAELIKDMEQWGDAGEEETADKKARLEAETAKFKVADSDGDGVLDTKELPALFYPETHDGVLELTTQGSLKAKDRDGDGKLTMKEFWEGDAVDGEDLAVSDEEKGDFAKLDKNGDGFLDLQELKAWESGKFHTEEAMGKLFELADKDSDMHVTADELDAAKEQIAGTDAQYHLMEWAEHHEL